MSINPDFTLNIPSVPETVFAEFSFIIETEAAGNLRRGIHLEWAWEAPEWLNSLSTRFNQSTFGRWLRS